MVWATRYRRKYTIQLPSCSKEQVNRAVGFIIDHSLENTYKGQRVVKDYTINKAYYLQEIDETKDTVNIFFSNVCSQAEQDYLVQDSLVPRQKVVLRSPIRKSSEFIKGRDLSRQEVKSNLKQKTGSFKLLNTLQIQKIPQKNIKAETSTVGCQTNKTRNFFSIGSHHPPNSPKSGSQANSFFVYFRQDSSSEAPCEWRAS